MDDELRISEIRATFQKFQDGYVVRDISQLDDFMKLFDDSDPHIEFIGIGASKRSANEWFVGLEAIREIVKSDWEFWGLVSFDVEEAQINVSDEIAWLSSTGTLEQIHTFEDALPLYLEQMGEILTDSEREPNDKLLEATHFGMRRLRERGKGFGYQWPLVFTAVLVHGEDGWKFNMTHWSMPVD